MFDEGKPPQLGGIVQGARKAMARWKREDAGEGSNVVVFEDCRWVGNQVGEGKIEAEVLFSVVVRGEGDGVNDGMLAHPGFKGRGVFGIGADFDGDKDELGDIVEREFSGANVDEGGPIQADNACLEGVIGDLGRFTKDAKAILAGVEDDSHLEDGNSTHGGRKVNFEKVDGVSDLLFGKGGMPASEAASSITLFGLVELGEDKGANVRNKEGHLGG